MPEITFSQNSTGDVLLPYPNNGHEVVSTDGFPKIRQLVLISMP